MLMDIDIFGYHFVTDSPWLATFIFTLIIFASGYLAIFFPYNLVMAYMYVKAFIKSYIELKRKYKKTTLGDVHNRIQLDDDYSWWEESLSFMWLPILNYLVLCGLFVEQVYSLLKYIYFGYINFKNKYKETHDNDYLIQIVDILKCIWKAIIWIILVPFKFIKLIYKRSGIFWEIFKQFVANIEI